MLRMSKLADYAFVILSHMMESPSENWSASSLASSTSLPLPTVAKLMKLLARGGIVGAQRGAAGGYAFIKDPSALSIVQIIEAVDGPISLTECAGKAVGKKTCDCAVGGVCPIQENWKRVNGSVMESLEKVKLSEFAVSQGTA